MADDLLEEIENKDELQEMQRDTEAASPTKGSRLKGLLGRVNFKGLLGSKKRLIIAGAGLLLLLILTVGLFFFFSSSDDPAADEQSLVTAETDSSQVPEIIFEDIVVLAPFENLPLKTGSAMQSLSLSISLELIYDQDRKLVVPVEHRLRKIVEGQVREMTWLELRNPEGKLRLKFELLRRMNSIFPKAAIRNIYFTHFIMQ